MVKLTFKDGSVVEYPTANEATETDGMLVLFDNENKPVAAVPTEDIEKVEAPGWRE